jgi:hypothetical protein
VADAAEERKPQEERAARGRDDKPSRGREDRGSRRDDDDRGPKVVGFGADVPAFLRNG